MYSNPKQYSIKSFYRANYLLYGALPAFIENRKTKLVSETFIERLMLAVTQVNGCEACSYAHTKMAFELGLSKEEINSFLSGSKDFVKEDEALAILFSQHYADSDGHPDCEMYNRITETYGAQISRVILSAVQVMQYANIFGIPLSAFLSRLKGKRYENSSLLREIGLPLSSLLIVPIAFIHYLIKRPQPLCPDK